MNETPTLVLEFFYSLCLQLKKVFSCLKNKIIDLIFPRFCGILKLWLRDNKIER